MKAEELMVGDWVFDTYTAKPMRIEGINEGNPRFGQDLEPIPLTPEILEKWGFEKGALNVSYQYNFAGGNCFIGVTLQETPDRRKEILCINLKTKMECTFTSASPDCQWCVHDLQHCLKMAGIEKEIEL